MKNTLETRLGLFVALIVIAAFFITFIVGGFEKFQAGLRVDALFNTAQELKLGDRVKLAGVEVGKVEKIELDGKEKKVRVTMKLRANTPIKTDTTAAIKFAGLMGQNFIFLDFGSAQAPAASDGITLNTVEQADLSVIMQKLDNVASGVENLTKSFTGDTIENLVGPLTDFVKQNTGPLTATIANMRAMSTQIAEGKGSVGKMIYDDALYNTSLVTISNLQVTSGEINIAIADARKIINGINAGEGSVGKLLKDERLYAETTASMTNLKEILVKLNQGQGTIGKLINDQEFYKNAKLTLQKVDKATEGLEDQGPLSVLGIMANGLF
jgi:phospholipid/cholesterol/gamma-HCH transport system substrate-binding protein